MFQKLIAEITNALMREGVLYMVTSGETALVHGEPGTIRVIDITLGAGVDLLSAIRRIAESLSLRPVEGQSDEFIKQSSVFAVVDEASGIRIDFVFSFTPYERQAIKRAVTVKFGEAYVRVATIEDAIVHRMFSGRPHDVEDVRGIMARNPFYDKEYLKKWLTLFSVVVRKDLWREFVKIEENSIGTPQT